MQLVPNSWKVGDVILDLYKVTNLLGEGGFGKVYKVRHTGWNIDLAVKSPKPEIVAAAGGVENFEREAQTWVNLGLHPHTVSCYYVRRIESSPLVFAEYVAGGSLQDWIENRQLYDGGTAASLKRILDIAIQFAWGLHYAHEQGLVHQDVKPANVMLTPQCAVKVTDFGLAKGRTLADRLDPPPTPPYQGGEQKGNSPLYQGREPQETSPLYQQGEQKNSPLFKGSKGGSADGTLLITGNNAMTPAYCSPEQANRETLTRRTDLWSWGLCVLEMFQGGRSWQIGTIAAQVLEFYLQGRQEDSQLPQMPNSVAQLLRRCFQENPDERPGNMLDVANELQGIYQQVTGEAYPRTEPKAGKDIADSLNNRAVSLLDLGRQEEALQLWEQALQVQPQHPEATYNRGLILWRSAKINDDLLIRDMEQVRQSHAGAWVANYLLGLVHLERDDCEAAIKTLESIRPRQKLGFSLGSESVSDSFLEMPNRPRQKLGFSLDSESVSDSFLEMSIQGEGAQQQEVKAALILEVKPALALARERLSHSSQQLRTFSTFKRPRQKLGFSLDSESVSDSFLEMSKGHTGYVTSVCLSADSRFALSGSHDKTLKLWEVATGLCLRTFAGHADQVNSVFLSVDSRFALSGSGTYNSHDNTLKLWEVATGRCLRTFTGHTESVNSVYLSADNLFALSGSDDKTLKLWEVATGRCLRTFAGHSYMVNSVCLSADNLFALSGSSDNTLKLWEVDTGRCLLTFKGHTSGVTSACLSIDSRLALSGSGDNTLKLWEIATGHCLRTFAGNTDSHNNSVLSVCLSADSRLVLSGSYNNTLKLWEVATGRCLRTFAEHTSGVKSVCLSADSRFALSGSSDNTLKLWTINYSTNPYLAPMILSRVLATETVLSINLTYQRELEQAQAALDRHDYVVAAQHIRKARSQPGYSRSAEALNAWASLYVCLPRKAFLGSWESATFAGQDNENSVCLSADSRFAMSGSSDKTLKLWEVATGRCLRTFTGHTDRGLSVCLSADSRFALSGSSDKTLKLWEVATGRCLRTFTGHTSGVSSVCLSADSRFALSGGSYDKTLKLWEVDTGRCLRTFSGHTDGVLSVCLSADSRFALSGSGNPFYSKKDNTLKLWEVATGRCLRTFTGHTSGVSSVCLSADSRFALSGSADCTLKLWEVATGHCLRTFAGHTIMVTSVCLSADSQFALSGSYDNTLKLWEVATGRCLHTFAAHTDNVNSVCLSTDSRFALSASDDKTLKLWVLDWELEDQPPADWDKRAQPYLENFLTLHTPYAATLPENRDPIEEEITLALTRRGTPTCTEEDFKKLLYTLGCAGYGWLRPEGVRQQLKAIAGIEPSAAGHTVAQEKHKSNGEFPNSQLPVANSQSNQMPAKVTLTVTEGSLKGREFVFDSRTTCIIGRAKDCNPQLPDDAEHNTISRYHCLLDINPPDIRIRDFGSKNGTYVNDQKIGQRQPDQSPEEGAQLNFPEYDLKAGDTIKLGNTVFQVSIQVDNQATQTPNLVNTPVYATKIAPEPPKFSEVIKGLLQQADAGESKLLAIRGYTTLRELGQGGCGAVYLARHDQTSELVALKVMLSKVAAKPSAIDMFLREIENNKALQHPNVVQLRAYGYDNGTFFFTLDYCNGGSVADLMRQRGGKLSIDEAVPIILQTLDGLNYAHNTEIPCVKCANGTIAKGRGLVHRDLKPHNILLANVNGSRVAKIADYGLAKAFDLAGLSGQTMTGHAAGTPRFMPRQQVINFKHAKPEVDVWAVAASLYNMLTGAYPRDFGNQDPFLAVLQTNPVLIRQRDALIPKRLAELIDLALVDNPEIHFKNAAAFKRALESVV